MRWGELGELGVLVGQVMSPHHSDQMSQRSQDFRVALLGVFVCQLAK